MNTLVLSWKDKDGNEHSREYKPSQASEVEKARHWLINQGADDIDVAIRVDKPKKQEEAND